MFVTFYSYKGGVGRTLALANIAYAFSVDKREPCKVLVWDFDLEAPGLEKILGTKWGNRKEGFVDIVNHYLKKAGIPSIFKYIHPTKHKNIDILPAGYIDKNYANKLDYINWPLMYEQAMGYDFIKKVKEEINNSRRYDYVLIDSRTGFSDMGGICTMQIPDLDVLMFRLDEQNLEGIERVYNTIKNYNSKLVGRLIGTLPVASPIWPFVSSAVNEQLPKAKKIFEDLEKNLKERNINRYPLQISFEADLISKEKIILEEENKYQVIPKIILDYKELAGAIRKFNEEDPLTLILKVRKLKRENKYTEALEILNKVVTLRPENDSYWNDYANHARMIYQKDRKIILSFLDSFEKDHLNNPYPNIVRGMLEENLKKSNEYFEKAIKLKPDLKTAYIISGTKNLEYKKYRKAKEIFMKILKLDRKDINALYSKAVCETYLEHYRTALKDIERAIRISPQEDFYYMSSRLNFYIGEYQKSLDDYSKIISPSIDRKIFLTHILAALNREKEGIEILKEIKAKDSSDALNIAEASIVLKEFDHAITFLSEYNDKFSSNQRQRLIAKGLKIIIDTLKNKTLNEKQYISIIGEIKKYKEDIDWTFEELEIFLRREVKNQHIPINLSKKIDKLISSFKETKTFKGVSV